MGKIAFVFPGQGAQYVGMGRDLAAAHPEFRRTFDEAGAELGFDLAALCFDGPEATLRETANTQPAILTHSVACLRLLTAAGIAPGALAGLSLGEYAALVAADALDFAPTVTLVRQRGIFMQEAVPLGHGTMAAIVGLEAAQVEEACRQAAAEGVVSAANYNCPGQIVIAGHVPAVEKAMAVCTAMGAGRTILLPVSAPFHCSLLVPAGERLAAALDGVQIRTARVPVVANVTAAAVTAAAEIRSLLIQQVSAPVRWEDSVRTMMADGVDTFIEVGPGRALSGFIRKIDRKVRVLNVEDAASLDKVLDSCGRVC